MKQLLIIGGVFVVIVGSYFMVFGDNTSKNQRGRYNDVGSYASETTGRSANTWTKAS